MTAQGILTTLIPVFGLIGALMLFLIRESKDAGRRESKLDKLLDEVHEVKRRLDAVPELDKRLGQVEALYDTLRSDIKNLRPHHPSWHDREE